MFLWNEKVASDGVLAAEYLISLDEIREDWCCGVPAVLTAVCEVLDAFDENPAKLQGLISSLQAEQKALIASTTELQVKKFFLIIPGTHTLLLRVSTPANPCNFLSLSLIHGEE
mmetsp:Transcript_13030/g.28343  ORF Transcript_13030/g.28343 Transcript_13030/m.28343 type:complete len:114 (-) Transcript_13030:370-711(-)